MEINERTAPSLSAIAESGVDTDALFDALADSRRRFVLAYLWEQERSVSLREVAARIADRERDEQSGDAATESLTAGITADEITSVHIGLYHAHIPKLCEAGVVEYSRDRDAVTLTAEGDELVTRIAVPGVATEQSGTPRRSTAGGASTDNRPTEE